VDQALRIDEVPKNDLTARLKKLTGLENPNSVTQLKAYLAKHGIFLNFLDKKGAAELILPPHKRLTKPLL